MSVSDQYFTLFIHVLFWAFYLFNNNTMNIRIDRFQYVMHSLYYMCFFFYPTKFNLKVWNSACSSSSTYITTKNVIIIVVWYACCD